MKFFKSIIIAAFILINCPSYGQVSQGGIPYSFEIQSRNLGTETDSISSMIESIIMPIVSNKTTDSIIQKNIANNSFTFAVSFDVNIDVKACSTIDSLDFGLLYRLSIYSPNAKSINLIFSKYIIPSGAKLYIYSVDRHDVIGAFTSNNNKESAVLPTIPVCGDEIIVEYFEPYISSFDGELVIGTVNHDFLGESSPCSQPADLFGESGDCNVDINCNEGANWQIEKNAVVKIIINGQAVCSGTLINNTSYDGTPYILTAFHCLDNNQDGTLSTQDKDISNYCFIFQYESPTCNGVDGSMSYSVSGGYFRAANFDSDFALIEMSRLPISYYDPYYAGWDRNTTQNAGAVCIHHPAGDVKKISTFDNVPLTSIDCFSDRPNANFWFIDEWTQTLNGYGITEHGSSGSALFNAEHRIIGQLRGGCSGYQNVNCSDPENDVSTYGKISASWYYDGIAENQLINWLDPFNNNPTVLDGAGLCQQITNVTLNLTHTVHSGVIEIQSASNTITSSSMIESGGTSTYHAGQNIVLEEGFTALEGSSFHAYISPSENCIVGCYPMTFEVINNLFSSGGNLCFYQTNTSSVTLMLISLGSSVVYQYYGAVNSYMTCIPMPGNLGNGSYQARVTLNSDCEELTKIYWVEQVGAKSVLSDSSKKTENHDYDFTIYPNPNSGDFYINIEADNPNKYKLDIIGSNGMILYKIEEFSETNIRVDKSSLAKGIYYIRISTSRNSISKKLIVQ